MSQTDSTVPQPTAMRISDIPEAVIRIAGNSQDGIQAIGGLGQDGLLLQLAAQIERALDGKWNGGRLPKVHVTA